MEHQCRNCLFENLNKEQFTQNIQDYVQSLSPDEKAGERLYKERLEVCFQCEQCLEGLCRVCGCFVLARAAKNRAYCPAVIRKW
ncbi:MAG: hypothetical protein GX115_09520 [Ruminiclostridium sp.]|nr:hypothetical protein [Ruminiclostridium sp.]